MNDPREMDLYCRISKDYDGTLRSVESQEEDLLEVVDDHPEWSVGKVWHDPFLSAWNRNVVRPSFDAMMERLESGATGGVLVYDLTRFTRKPEEGERLIQAAQRGIVVASVNTQYDLLTADGREAFRNAMTRAAGESDKISERSSRGKRKKAKRGRSNASRRGFARPGFLPNPEGWETGDPRVEVPADQLAREVAGVRDAAARLLAGDTLMAICREWNAAELLTSTGKQWDGAMLRQLLLAPSLAGYTATRPEGQKEWTILGRMEGEPVLEPEVWDRLILHLGSRKRGRPATEYLLSGIITCGKCGSLMYGRPLTSQPPYADGTVKRQYWCQVMLRSGTGCGALTIDQRFADAVVTERTLARLQDPRHADRVARVAAKVEQAQRSIAAELHDLQAEADAVAAKTGTPGWTLARVDSALANYDERIADAEARLKDLGEVPDAGYDDGAQDWDSATVAMRRAMVKRAFPEGLHVEPATSRGRASLLEARIKPGTYPGRYPLAS